VIIRNSRLLSEAVPKLFPPIITDLIFATKNIQEDLPITSTRFSGNDLGRINPVNVPVSKVKE
jgi:hypothetical protein